MTENEPKTTIPDPEDLTEAERQAILKDIRRSVEREFENKVIAKELARRAQESERRETS